MSATAARFNNSQRNAAAHDLELPGVKDKRPGWGAGKSHRPVTSQSAPRSKTRAPSPRAGSAPYARRACRSARRACAACSTPGPRVPHDARRRAHGDGLLRRPDDPPLEPHGALGVAHLARVAGRERRAPVVRPREGRLQPQLVPRFDPDVPGVLPAPEVDPDAVGLRGRHDAVEPPALAVARVHRGPRRERREPGRPAGTGAGRRSPPAGRRPRPAARPGRRGAAPARWPPPRRARRRRRPGPGAPARRTPGGRRSRGRARPPRRTSAAGGRGAGPPGARRRRPRARRRRRRPPGPTRR